MDINASSSMHASMDCCPQGADSQDTDNDNKAGKCSTSLLAQQPVVAEDVKLQFDDQIEVAISVFPSDFPASASSGNFSVSSNVADVFSLQAFSSYRKLLI